MKTVLCNPSLFAAQLVIYSNWKLTRETFSFTSLITLNIYKKIMAGKGKKISDKMNKNKKLTITSLQSYTKLMSHWFNGNWFSGTPLIQKIFAFFFFFWRPFFFCVVQAVPSCTKFSLLASVSKYWDHIWINFSYEKASGFSLSTIPTLQIKTINPADKVFVQHKGPTLMLNSTEKN